MITCEFFRSKQQDMSVHSYHPPKKSLHNSLWCFFSSPFHIHSIKLDDKSFQLKQQTVGVICDHNFHAFNPWFVD